MRFSLNSIYQAAILLGVCVFGLASPISYAQDTRPQDTHFIVVGNMDRSINPGDNFFEYAKRRVG